MNRDRFIVHLLSVTDSTHFWRNFRGSGQLTQRMLEAKGHGYEWMFKRYPGTSIGENYYDDTMGQAERQNTAGAGRGVDWHFADRGEALFFYLEFKAHHFDNVRVYYTEAIVKKAEECISWVKETLKPAVPYEGISTGKRFPITWGRQDEL